MMVAAFVLQEQCRSSSDVYKDLSFVCTGFDCADHEFWNLNSGSKDSCQQARNNPANRDVSSSHRKNILVEMSKLIKNHVGKFLQEKFFGSIYISKTWYPISK